MISELNQKVEQSDILAGSWVTVTPTGSGVTISATWVAWNSVPYISNQYTFTMQPSSTTDFSITGLNFTPTTTVSIPSWAGTINSTMVNSPTSIDVNLTSGVTETSYDVVVDNWWIDNTAWTGNGQNLIEVLTSTWVDLRAGWDVFTDGNAAGNDIRYRAGMSMTRDANGMYFTGSNPWSSWVKFENLAWARGSGQTLEWIFTTPTAAMMIGIGSDATDETSTTQYYQSELVVYLQNASTMWWLFGNNGTPGWAGSQGNSTAIWGCASWVYKSRFTDDGTVWSSIFTLYCLPSAWLADWDNTATVITTFAVWGTLNPDEVNIMPFIIPRDGGTQRFIALKVD